VRTLPLADGELDLVDGVVKRGGAAVALTPVECRILACLAAVPGGTVDRESLVEAVWAGKDMSPHALDNAISRLRRKVEQEPRRPAHLLTIRGEGFRLVPGEVAPVSAPPATEDLVGRQSELASLAEALGTAGLVTLVGPGGVGKTSLARAQLAAWRAEGGEACFVPLEQATGLEGLVRATARALQVRLGGRTPREDLAALGRTLAGGGRALVILDNCEQVVDGAAEAIEAWRALAPEARLLATTRRRLGLPGERCLQVGTLPPAEAAVLFARRAQAARPGLRIDPGEATAIVEALDGLPLAIELAAARLDVLQPAALRAALDRRFELVAGRRRDLAPRQATLRATLAWSWGLLTRAEQEALARLAAFRGGFTVTLAERVLARPAGAPPPLDLLQALLEHSLLRRSASRLDLYESVRAFAEEEAPDEVARALPRHGRQVVAWAEEQAAGLFRKGGPARRRRLEAEQDNLLAVVDREQVPDPWRVRAALILLEILRVRGPLGLAERVAAQAVEAAARCGAELEVAARRERAYVLRVRGELEAARAEAEHALALARQDGRPALVAGALKALGLVLCFQGRPAEAADLAAEAMQAFEAQGDPCAAARARVDRAAARLALGQYVPAREDLERALKDFRALGYVEGEARALASLAGLALEGAELRRAELLCWRGWTLCREAEVGILEVLFPTTLAMVRWERGDPAGGARLCAAALKRVERFGAPALTAQLRGHVAMLEAEAGDPAGARPELEAALAAARELGGQASVRMLAGFLALVAARMGDEAAARSALAESRAAAVQEAEALVVDLVEAAVLARMGAAVDPAPPLARAEGGEHPPVSRSGEVRRTVALLRQALEESAP